MRDRHAAAFATGRTLVASGHGGVGGRLVEKHQTVRVEVALAFEPVLALGLYVAAILLGRVCGLFFTRDGVAREEPRQRTRADLDAVRDPGLIIGS
jgi:hypothetical protein